VEHESFSRDLSKLNLTKAIDQLGSRDAGVVVDSGVALSFDEVFEKHPSATWILIMRDPADVEVSLRKVFNWDIETSRRVLGYFSTAINHIQAKLGPRAIVFYYKELTQEVKMAELWAHVMPLTPWNSRRFHRMNALNIQHKDFTSPEVVL
jgi:hypothetical protein